MGQTAATILMVKTAKSSIVAKSTVGTTAAMVASVVPVIGLACILVGLALISTVVDDALTNRLQSS